MAKIPGKQISDDAIDSQHIAAGAVDAEHLSAGSKQSVLESKLALFPSKIDSFSAGSSGSASITDAAFQAAKTDGGADCMAFDGSASQKGVSSNPSVYNRCEIQDHTTKDPVLDTNSRQVFGRLTKTKTAKTGTATMTVGSTAVVGVDTLFSSEFSVGDYIAVGSTQQKVGKIASIESDTALTLEDNWAGTTESGTPAEVELTLTYKKIDGTGSEVAHTMGGETIDILMPVAFDLYEVPITAFIHNIEFSAEAPDAGHVDPFTGEAVAAGAAFVQTLTATPLDVTKVKMFVNGLRMKYGTGNDFTVSGTTVTWLATADFAIEATDEVIFEYV